MIDNSSLAVLFDMNGVIVDDEALHEEAFAEILKREGILFDHSIYLKYFAGRTDRDGFLRLQQSEKLDFDVDLLAKDKSLVYQRLAEGNLRAYPGVIECIRGLREKGVSLGLVTGAVRKETKNTLKVLGIADAFSAEITGEDVKKGKPAPEGYLKAAEGLGVEPSRCLVLEDAPAGIAAAHAAGMRCIAVLHTHSREDLVAADKVISGFDEGSIDSLLRELPMAPRPS